MEIGPRSTLVWDVFNEYTSARREFFAALEQFAIKGSPDRSNAIRRVTRLQGLLCDQEVARLRYVLAISSDASMDSYTRVGVLRQRLTQDWTPSDEDSLSRNDPGYVALQREIETARSSSTGPADLDGPYEMVKRDAGFIAAANVYDQIVRALNGRLEQRESDRRVVQRSL